MIYCVQRAGFKPLWANRLASWNLTVQRSWGQSTNTGSKVLPFPSLPCSLMFQHSLFALCWWDLAARCCVTQDKQWIMSGHNECATWVWLLPDLDAIKTEERNFFGLVLFTGSCVVKAFGTSRAGSNPANSKVILNVQTAHLSSDSTPLVALYKSVFSQS